MLFILLSFVSGAQGVWDFAFLFQFWGLFLFAVGISILLYNNSCRIIKFDKESDKFKNDYASEETRRAGKKKANNVCEKREATSSLQVHHNNEDKHVYETEKKESDYETEPAPKDPKIELLLNAIENKKELEFDYINSKGEKTHRTVLPDEVYHGYKNYIYVKAYCLKHKEEWSFRISRMSNLKLKSRRG